jgi:3-hydroxyisobutyrate dehydrogenase
MRIGFIGTGNIGAPMAANILKAGFDLVVHDIHRAKTEPLIAQGAVWADSPGVVAEQCDITCTCLPGPAEMEPVAMGPGGILEGARPGSVYIDHTTNSPLLARRVHEAFAAKGVAMLDAPVSGGVEGAMVRDLLVMVGGDEQTFQRCLPVLQAIGERVKHTGGVGTGCICKIMHNTAVFCADLAMTECWTLAIKSGVPAETIIDVFRNGAIGRMSNLWGRLPDTLFRGDFDARFALQTAQKDLRLGQELADAYDVPMPLAEVCRDLYSQAMDRGWQENDSSIVLTLQEERAGVQVRLQD